jgi:hypothetical protein
VELEDETEMFEPQPSPPEALRQLQPFNRHAERRGLHDDFLSGDSIHGRFSRFPPSNIHVPAAPPRRASPQGRHSAQEFFHIIE